MAVTFNIQNRDTIYFRTDCISANSRNTYHVRAAASGGYPKGYEKVVGVSDGLPYDIGHNPAASIPQNPIICDKLILFGEYGNRDLYYDSILFDSPALVLWDTYISSNTGDIMVNDNFYLINSLWASVYGGHIASVVGAGQSYWSVWGYDTWTGEVIVATDPTPSTYSYAGSDQFKLAVNRYGSTSKTPDIMTSAELIAKFNPADVNKTEYQTVINSFTHGALCLDKHDFTCYAYRNTGAYKAYLKDISSGDKPYIIMPFISESEREAAKAVLYHWDDSTVQAVQSAIHNA